MMRTKTMLLSAAATLAITTTAHAAPLPQSAPPSGSAVAKVDDVIVTADPLNRSGDQVVSSVAVLSGDNLVHRREATLGDTLNGLPGVSSDTFGGGASRPVIRGQTAPRVKVLSSGSALLDASEVSPDHAIGGETLLLQGVEILRGPSALLYGGGAIGGAVNLIDRKIPTAIPPRGGEGAAEVRIGSADNEEAAVAGLTAGGNGFAVRIEAARRKTDDYRVPDWSEKRLDGSANDSRTATLGASWIGSRGYLGVAYTQQNSTYGLPGHSHEYESCHPHGTHLHCGGHGHNHDEDGHDHDHDHEHGHGHAPTVDLVSRRTDVRGELRDPFAGVERIRFRGGYTDYAHDERDDGQITTTFTNRGYDARVEVQHAPIGRVRGVIGGQVARSDFAAEGLESFIRPSRTETSALFVLETFDAGAWTFEGAVRQEWQKTGARGDVAVASRPDRDFQPFSASIGANWRFAPDYVLSLSAARSQRAPNIQELYARGVHLATNTYELGSVDLKTESVVSLEAGIKKTQGQTTFGVSAYRYAYDGYIYADTLDRFEDFRLIRYAQHDATFTGLEAEATHRFLPNLSATVFGDYVRAELDDGGDLPRIPAGRLGARTDMIQGPWSGSVEYVRVFEQDRVASYETTTPGYNMVNATAAYDFDLGPTEAQIYVRGTNLLNELAFNHASFISDLAPLRGRNLVLGLRARF